MGPRLASFRPGRGAAQQGLREVNRQHARIFALVGEFNASVKGGNEPPRLLIVLEEIIERVETHTETEEAMLKAVGHASYRMQRGAHRRILDELAEFRGNMVAGRDLSPDDYLHLLDTLIIHHIRDEPAVFARRTLAEPPGGRRTSIETG